MSKKIRMAISIILNAAYMLGIIYAVTLVREWLNVYNLDFTHFTKEYFLSLLSGKTLIEFLRVDMCNIFGWAVIGIGFICFLLNSQYRKIKKGKTFTRETEYGSHGTARFQTEKEKEENYGQTQLGWFLGTIKSGQKYKLGLEALYHPVNGDLNMQMIVVGSPGSQKTTGFVLPNILHIPYIYEKLKDKVDGEMPDLIITDPKSELHSLSAAYLKEKNYDIKILDFIHLKYGAALNCIEYINSEKELMEISEGYIASIEHSIGGGKDNGFWAEQEGQALGALIGAIQQNKPEGERTFKNVLIFLTTDLCGIDGSIDMVKSRTYFEDNVKGAPLQLWRNFLLICKSDTTAGNILGGLAGKLKYFAIKEVDNITNHTTIDIKQLGRKKEKPIALFILMPDSDRTFSPIINVILNTIFKQLYKTAYDSNNRLPNPVYFILEEMANIGKISGMQEMLGTMRGRRIYPMMIWQSLSQLKDRYKEGWEDVYGQCDTKVFLGVNDKFTAQYCSEMLGKCTIKINGENESNKGVLLSNKSLSANYIGRSLLFPDEVMSLDNKKYILSQRAKNPALINKVQYRYWNKQEQISTPIPIQDMPLLCEKESICNKSDDEVIRSKMYQKEIERDENKDYEQEIEMRVQQQEEARKEEYGRVLLEGMEKNKKNRF